MAARPRGVRDRTTAPIRATTTLSCTTTVHCACTRTTTPRPARNRPGAHRGTATVPCLWCWHRPGTPLRTAARTAARTARDRCCERAARPPAVHSVGGSCMDTTAAAGSLTLSLSTLLQEIFGSSQPALRWQWEFDRWMCSRWLAPGWVTKKVAMRMQASPQW